MQATNTPTTTDADGAPTPPQTTELTVEQALAAAINLQRNKHLPQAEAIFQAVLEADPDSPDAHHFLGVLRHQQGRRDEAATLIQRAVDLCPTYADAYNNLGNVLRALQRYPEAMDAFDRAVEHGPNLAEAHMNRAGLLRRCNRLPEAVAAYRRAVELKPDLAQAHFHLGNALYMMGLIEEAADAFANWHQIEPDNPVARHMAAACGAGLPPERASDGYVRQAFDAFAEGFDEKMQSLHYGAPDLVAAAVAARYEPRAQLDVLDAGCGTGLCAPLLAPFARHLTGVDLSAGMVDKARARGGYHDLVVAELTAFLTNGPPARYDLIVSADTLVYFGSLDDVLRGAAASLRPGGHLVFTVEAADGDDGDGFVLNPHGRYAHREPYVRDVLGRAAGLEVLEVAREPLRMEMGQPVRGLIVTARKPGPSPHNAPTGSEK
jgi:predicted TPR repeat methyltransferase